MPEGFETTEDTGTEETPDTGAEDTGQEYDETHLEGDSGDTDGSPDSTETGTEEPEVADPYADFGGREVIERAHQMYQAAQTQDGITRLFIEAGQALGFSGRDLDAFVTKAMGQEPDAADETDEDDDRYLTVKEMRELEAKREEQRQAKEREAQVETARTTVAETMKDLGIDPQDPTAEVILKLGDKHLNGKLDSASVAAAVRKGHADFLALVEKQAKEYSRKKADTRKRVPKAPSGGSAPSTPAPKEPQNSKEAILAVRKMLRGES